MYEERYFNLVGKESSLDSNPSDFRGFKFCFLVLLLLSLCCSRLKKQVSLWTERMDCLSVG